MTTHALSGEITIFARCYVKSESKPSAQHADFNLKRVLYAVEIEADFFNRIGHWSEGLCSQLNYLACLGKWKRLIQY